MENEEIAVSEEYQDSSIGIGEESQEQQDVVQEVQPQTSIEKVLIPVEYKGKVYNLTPEQAGAWAKKSLGLAETAQTAKQYKEQLEQLKEQMEKMDVVESLRRKGFTSAQIKEHLTDIYGALIEEEQESPEQKELKQLKKYKEEQEKKSKEIQNKAQQAKEQMQIEKYTKSISEELAKELETSDLPKHPFFGKFVIQEMMSAQMNGYEMTTKEAVKIAEAQVKTMLEDFVGSMSPTQLSKMLGKKFKDVREASVAEFKQKPNTAVASSQSAQVESITNNNSNKPRKKININEYFRTL